MHQSFGGELGARPAAGRERLGESGGDEIGGLLVDARHPDAPLVHVGDECRPVDGDWGPPHPMLRWVACTMGSSVTVGWRRYAAGWVRRVSGRR